MSFAKINGVRSDERRVTMERMLLVAKLAVAHALGLSRVDAALRFDVPWKTAQSWREKHKHFFLEIEGLVKELTKPDLNAASPLVEEADYKAEMGKRLGKALTVMDRALEAGDIRTAMEAMKELHRVKGYSTKVKHEHGGSVEVQHKVVPAGLLATVNKPRERRALPPLQVVSITKAENDSPN